ncbi:calcium-activated chloride channel-domain-containing protein [Clohesyomyces aquaticus]|uniref:Calcium-activated chloride channel-domain-containing protein n=1 Tax=Clohesyomyces aquaticus TaxID=1231657 RepID=A0A1Y1YZ81_9PLEO|nr:calcium-activated chloride channel-domain-containing protein [Clohesyomyces aquaticus]
MDLLIRWNVKGVDGLKVSRPNYFYNTKFVDATGVLIAIVFTIEIPISEAAPRLILGHTRRFCNFLEEIASGLTEYENHRTHLLRDVTDPEGLRPELYHELPSNSPHGICTVLHSTFGGFIGYSISGFEVDPNRLRNEVIALTVTGQISNLAEELIYPYLKTQFRAFYREYRASQSRYSLSQSVIADDPSEKKFLKQTRTQATLEPYNVHEDISQMVIQFGYLALFSPICVEHQRPAPVRSDGIGPWTNSLEALTWLGSITTATIVHLCGSTTPGYKSGLSSCCYLLVTVFIFEHVVLVLRAGVRYVLRKIGSHHIRLERSERYAERKKYLDELGKSSVRTGHLEVEERERRKSVRVNGMDLFWTRQAEEGKSAEAGVGLILRLKEEEQDSGRKVD